jgi:hypothetical protein
VDISIQFSSQKTSETSYGKEYLFNLLGRSAFTFTNKHFGLPILKKDPNAPQFKLFRAGSLADLDSPVKKSGDAPESFNFDDPNKVPSVGSVDLKVEPDAVESAKAEKVKKRRGTVT